MKENKELILERRKDQTLKIKVIRTTTTMMNIKISTIVITFQFILRTTKRFNKRWFKQAI
jgi:hypothetical protein